MVAIIIMFVAAGVCVRRQRGPLGLRGRVGEGEVCGWLKPHLPKQGQPLPSAD